MNLVVTPLSPNCPAVLDRVATDVVGEPLRCCLRLSRPGERLALVSVTPPGPTGAYAETGPVFVHADGCAGPESDGYPAEFRARAQVFRAYDADGRICGGELVAPDADGGGQEAAATRLLGLPGVAFLHSRNVVYGCYMFAVRQARVPGH